MSLVLTGPWRSVHPRGGSDVVAGRGIVSAASSPTTSDDGSGIPSEKLERVLGARPPLSNEELVLKYWSAACRHLTIRQKSLAFTLSENFTR